MRRCCFCAPSRRARQYFEPRNASSITFIEKLRHLRQGGADMDNFDPLEVFWIAGTTMEDTLSFDVAGGSFGGCRGIGSRGTAMDQDANWAHTGPRFLPLLKTTLLSRRAYVAAWLESGGAGRRASPAWLVERVTPLPFLRRAAGSRTLRISARAVAVGARQLSHLPHTQLAAARAKCSITRVRDHPQSGFAGARSFAQASHLYCACRCDGETRRRHDSRGHAGPLPRALRHHAGRSALSVVGAPAIRAAESQSISGVCRRIAACRCAPTWPDSR